MNERAARLWLYGDVTCPWSYLALARIRRMARSIPIVLGWRPLSGTVGSAASDRQASPDPAWTVPDQADFERLAVPFVGWSAHADSRDALLALEFARDLGQVCLDRTLDGLFTAHFGFGVDLSERTRLLEVCGDLDLDLEALELALDDGRYEPQLQRIEDEADRYGIDRIPTIIAGRSKIVGAAPLDVLSSVVRAAAEGD